MSEKQLIYKEKALEILDDFQSDIENCIPYAYSNARARMAGLYPRSEWIPCSERMPEEKEWIGTKQFGTTISDIVLVTFEAQGERFVNPMHFQNGELGGSDKRMMDAFYDEWKAVAWMPLPKPYEEGDHE